MGFEEVHYEILDVINAKELKKHLVTLLMGYLNCESETFLQTGFYSIAGDMDQLFAYLDSNDPFVAGELFDIVPARTLMTHIVRMMCGYFWQNQGNLEFHHGSLFDDIACVLFELTIIEYNIEIEK